MNYPAIISGLILLMILAAGCSDESGPDTVLPFIEPPAEEALYTAGDIVAKTATQAEPFWIILGFDQKTDRYERALVFRRPDNSFYRKDTRTDLFPRHDMEKLYPVRTAHVAVSAVPVLTPTAAVTPSSTAASSGPSPEITGITPGSAASGSRVTITNLAGENFQPGATVQLIGGGFPPITASEVQAIDMKITCVFDLNGAKAGKRDVVVTNPDGKASTLRGAFTINEPGPVLSSIDPYSGIIGQTLTLTLKGSNFKNPAKVLFLRNGIELEAANVLVTSATEISCALIIPNGTEPGEWDVIVRNVADRQNSTVLKKFTISSQS